MLADLELFRIGEGDMNILLIIGIILLVLWLLGFVVLPVLGWLIHVALVIAVIFIIIWLLRKVFKLF
jgi:membrane-bound ClpP family serine protease